MARTLLITNDFPPRPGGIQAFVHQLAVRQPKDSLVVYASTSPGAAEFDAEQPFPVIRDATSMLLPTPGVSQRVCDLAQEFDCRTVWFGAAAPLGLLAPALRRAGVERVVAQTHGHEVWWAMIPGIRGLLRRVATGADVVTYLGEYTRSRLARALGDRTQLVRLPPGVDTDLYRPDRDARWVRERHKLGGAPLVVCVSRLVPRKGQDILIRALPLVHREVPEAKLLLVGGGRYESRLRRLVERAGLTDHVIFTGAVPWEELPSYYAAGNVFAMPCRTRRAGMDVEGLGMVYLEASASGMPVIVGDSGGAPDAVREGETGFVVDGRNVEQVAGRVTELLSDPERGRSIGRAGRAWVEREWQWDDLAAQMRELLAVP